jgi:hypothetical protein
MYIFVPKILYYRLSKKKKSTTKQAIKTSLGTYNNTGVESARTCQLNNDRDSPTQDRNTKTAKEESPSYEVDEENSLETAQALIKRDEKLLKKLSQLEQQISQPLQAEIQADDETNGSLELIVVDSPAIRESLIRENDLLKKTLVELQAEIISLRTITDLSLAKRKSC